MHFHDAGLVGQHEIGVGAGSAVFDIIKIEHRIAIVDPARNRRDLKAERIAGQRRLGVDRVDGEAQRHPGAGNRRRAGATIGLDHVAIQRDLAFAQQRQIGDRAQGAADQALDFLGAGRLLALGGFALATGMGGARQHAIFGRHPALAAAAQPRRHSVFHAGGHQHMGVAELDQARSFGVGGKAGDHLDGAHLIGGAA